MTQDKLFAKLLRQLNKQTQRLPGYAQIALTIMSMPLEERIKTIELILDWLKRYPDIEFQELMKKQGYAYGLMTVSFPCQDCEKVTEVQTVFQGKFEKDVSDNEKSHLVCQNCFNQKYAKYAEPDYDEDRYEAEELRREEEEIIAKNLEDFEAKAKADLIRKPKI